MHDYDPPAIDRPIKSNILSKNVCEKDYDFIKKYGWRRCPKMKELLEACLCL